MANRDPGNPASPLEPKSLNELLKYAPTLKGLKTIKLEKITAFDPPLDSSDVEPVHIMKMARIIRDNYDNYDGFVILHGTDTMAYTSSMLAFILNNLSKPVVITGAQLPVSDVRTDAVQNLVSAVSVAGYKAFDLPRIPEVVLCFSDKILRGCRATKASTDDYAGFDSPNYPQLGTIGKHIKINKKLVRGGPPEGSRFFINEELSDEVLENITVMSLSLWPGLKSTQLAAMLTLPNVNGIVLRTYGAGNIPNNLELQRLIEDSICCDAPRIILNVTQCAKGKVEMGRYASSSSLLECGVISGLDMTVEAALAKLYWALGTQHGEGIVKQLQLSQRGEQSENLFDLRYGGGGDENEPLASYSNSTIPSRSLEINALKRAVVRISDADFEGVSIGEVVKVRIFMNHPTATANTPVSDPRCVTELVTTWEGKPTTLIQEIALESAKTVIGEGEIKLTVVPLDGVKMWFKGLYLALFSETAY